MTALPAATVVVDLGYGDAGKGATVDRLCARQAAEPEAPPVAAVVRFNGGCQAAHNVVLDDGRTHTFAQFGSGTLRGVPTVLSRFALVEPVSLLAEAEALSRLGVDAPLRLLTVDGAALLTTIWHAQLNRAREQARGAARHGSCGRGVGETTAYALTAGSLAPCVADLRRPAVLRDKLEALARWTGEQIAGLGLPEGVVPGELVPPTVEAAAARLADIGALLTLADDGTLAERAAAGPLVLEGAQGVLLDEWRGFHPYTTWSTTTTANARTLLAEIGVDAADTTRLGLVRTFTVRHGAGPHPTQDAALERVLVERHNTYNRWQESFRIGTFDAVAHRYALEVCDVDALVVGHADWARSPFAAATSYRTPDGPWDRIVPGTFGDLAHQSQLTDRLLQSTGVVEHFAGDPADAIGELLDRPVHLVSHGAVASACLWRAPVGLRR